jgi:hypothetical protein
MQRFKRFISFLYWIPAVIIVVGHVNVPEWVFLALPLPFVIGAFILYVKSAPEERSFVEISRVVLILIAHFILYYMIYK